MFVNRLPSLRERLQPWIGSTGEPIVRFSLAIVVAKSGFHFSE
jgi:hypothetical protein